jgi:hypothetical protein
LGCAPENFEIATLQLRYVRKHRRSVLAERQATLIAQKQPAADALLKSIDPPHQGRACEGKRFGSVTEASVSRTGEKRFQVVPGRSQNLVGPVLRHRSTPVQ